MKRLTLAAIIAILMLSPTAVFADVFENFDQYPPGTVDPWSAGNPWTISYSSTAYKDCFNGLGSASAVTYLGGNPASSVYSPPNVFQLEVANNATCFAASHWVELTAEVNVTSAGIIESFDRIVSGSTTAVNDSFYLCNTKVASAVFTGEPTIWTGATYTAAGSTTGVECPVVFRLYTVAGGTAGLFSLQIDNLRVRNGNLVNTAANLFMADSELTFNDKAQWFNITNYQKSYAELDFASGQPLLYSNLTAPDIHVNYGAATILKLWVVPASYYVQIIPNDAGNNTVWLFDPAIVNTYTINIQDLSNQFGPNSTIKIDQGSRVMSSGYTDAQNSYPIWIVPGSYQLTITNGANVYSTKINFPSTSGASVSVQILKYKQSGNCGQICTIGYTAGFAAGSTSIVVSYTDSTGTTSSMTDEVWVNGPLGATEFYSKTWAPGPYASITDTVSCNNDSCNSTLASGIYVVLIFVNQYGSNTEHIPVSGGSLFATTPNLPGGILCWDCVFPTSPSPLNFAAYLIILVSASSMGALAAKFGAVVVAGEAAVLAGAGWLALADGAGLVLIAVGIVSFIGFLEAGR